MGEVYRATDTKLGRDVALKVLPPDVARDPERLARFQREARAIAALNHPHIVTIFSVEETDGVNFLTMELVEGQSLDRLISAAGLSRRPDRRHRQRSCRRPRRRPRKRHRPSRLEARQRHGHQRRPGQGTGLRARERYSRRQLQ
jgi:serine/threonine protein kinase